ncbi:hypothetical protein LCGC14_1681780 [marine sediment metagenome]|uniref:Phage terminase large subunit GpA ATPase domain-containing protein n=1 Tax=marine sediment metagenome TaxID=412755 RepID=A0A0F9HNG5_9ZZZZ
MVVKQSHSTVEKWFESIKVEVLKIDPVAFAENFLTIDGLPLRLGGGTGWKFLADVYRYVATKALGPEGKPVVCVKARQVGATTMAAALELYFCTSDLFGTSPQKPPIRILHCFPALSLVQKFAKDKLSTMIRTSKDNYIIKHALSHNEETGKRRMDVPDDTLTEKQFKNENKLWVDSSANDAQRLQGMSVDCIFYDEVQRMNQDDIGNSKRTLTAARYGPKGQGIQMYFGTPLQRGSDFYKMWEASDKRFYHLRCSACKEYFKLYEPGSDSWEEIWLYANIVKCPHCEHEQDKIEAVENGKWVPSQIVMSNGEEPQYIGFHFNQLLIPYFDKEAIIREKPGIHATNSERIWKNEILGEFYSGSELPMSEEEIYQYCRNINKRISYGVPSVSKNINPKVIVPYQSPTFMGIDWGGKNDDLNSTIGKSYSSVVIISADRSGVLQIENAFKLKDNSWNHKKAIVNEMYRRFNIMLTVADLGYGSDIVPELQREYGGRIIGCLNSGSLINPVKYDPEELRMIVNHHTILEEIFGNMRKSKVLFPWKSYEQIHWLIEHFCSMEKEQRTFQGRVITRYVKGTGPNDGLSAFMYAYLAYKFYLTQGFKVKNHQINAKSNGPILAYLPGI